jgi:RND family efflux transporter MFP subunit
MFPPPILEIPPTRVSVVGLAESPFEKTVPVAGGLSPIQSADVFPKVGGKVVKLYVSLGQRVKAGDPLATVEATEWGLQARQAEAGLSMATEAASLADRSVERLDRVQERLGPGVLAASEDEAARLQARGAQTQRDVARAQRDLAQQMVRNATMTSPIDGVVTRVAALPGNMVGQEYPAFHVDDLSAFMLRCQVGDLEAQQVSAGQRVRLRSDALPDRVLEGTVSAVGPSLDAWTRRAPVEIAVPAPPEGVLGNVFVRGEIVVGEDPAALVLPALSVERTLGRNTVQLVREGRILTAPVRVLAESRDRFSVAGLSPGDLVVLPGAEHLAEGEPVEVARRLELREALDVAQ